MNKLFATLIGISIATVSATAFAGPDWQIIERARQARHAEAQALSKQAASPRNTVRFAAQDPATMQPMKDCAETPHKQN